MTPSLEDKKKLDAPIEAKRIIAPAGTGQACGAANACHLYKGHKGKHQDYKLFEW